MFIPIPQLSDGVAVEQKEVPVTKKPFKLNGDRKIVKVHITTQTARMINSTTFK